MVPDSNGKSAFASDPSWAALLEWQKKLIADVYGPDGYKKLTAFAAELGGPDSEWSTSHGFEVGKIAMLFDGEWRTAFIKDDKSTVNYATAPFPVADNIASLYGRGRSAAIRSASHGARSIPQRRGCWRSSWQPIRKPKRTLAETLGNVPTTFEALKDPVLTADPHFKTFMEIFANPKSGFKELTPIGDGDQTLWSAFVDKWEAGKIPDPAGGSSGAGVPRSTTSPRLG